MAVDLEKFYDKDTKILNLTNPESLEVEDIARALMNFVNENYDFIVENTDDWYDIGYDIELIEQIPSLNKLSAREQQIYIQTLMRYDDSKELLIARYAWMIGLTRIVLYDTKVLGYETERLDNLAAIFDDSTPEDVAKASEIITNPLLYEKTIFEKESYMSDSSALKMKKEEMIAVYDSEHKPTRIN